MHLQKGHYYLDIAKKELYIFDRLVAEGNEALDYAFELSPPSEWRSLDARPFLNDMGYEEFQEYSFPF